MVVIVARGDAEKAVRFFQRSGQKSWIIGELARGPHGVTFV
jgi:phosphoribosylaminoimidazole (AIR) synthetase